MCPERSNPLRNRCGWFRRRSFSSSGNAPAKPSQGVPAWIFMASQASDDGGEKTVDFTKNRANERGMPGIAGLPVLLKGLPVVLPSTKPPNVVDTIINEHTPNFGGRIPQIPQIFWRNWGWFEWFVLGFGTLK